MRCSARFPQLALILGGVFLAGCVSGPREYDYNGRRSVQLKLLDWRPGQSVK